MKTVFMLIIFHLFYFVTLPAQQNDNYIAILPIKYEAGSVDQKNTAAQITDKIIDQLIQSDQAKVVEREFFNDLKNEKFLTSDVDFIEGITFSKTKSIGAKYILVGKISSFKIDKTKDGFSCQMTIGMRLASVVTGEIIYSFTLSNQSSSSVPGDLFGNVVSTLLSSSSKTEGEAVKDAVNNLSKDITVFADKYFPYEVNLKGISLMNKDNSKATEIEMKIGESKGVNVKQKFYIKERFEDEGEINYKIVGEVEIKEVNGKNLSTAKVIKGGDVIKMKMDQGAKLVAINKAK